LRRFLQPCNHWQTLADFRRKDHHELTPEDI
jgi:hypothetical protein